MKSKQAVKKRTAKSAKKAVAPKPVARPRTVAKAVTKQVRRGKSKPSAEVARKTPRGGKVSPAKGAARHASIFYRLNTLLSIVRNIAHYEDQLCTILHEIKTTGAADKALSQELADVLEDMPSSDYLQELDAVRAALP